MNDNAVGFWEVVLVIYLMIALAGFVYMGGREYQKRQMQKGDKPYLLEMAGIFFIVLLWLPALLFVGGMIDEEKEVETNDDD